MYMHTYSYVHAYLQLRMCMHYIPTCSRWQEGLLPQLLYGEGRGGGKGTRWVVLDGSMSGNQLDTLLTLLDPDQLIKLSNGRGIPIETTCKFILEVCTYVCIDTYT